MKNLLSIALLLLIVGCTYGQQKKDSTYITFKSVSSDTIPCVMLVTDTSFISVGSVVCRKGYVISKRNSLYVTYLDADKAPLPKKYIVWISRTFKK